MDALADKLVDQMLDVSSLPDTDYVLGLRGGANLMKAMKAMKAATLMKAMKAMKAMKKAKPEEAEDEEAEQDDEANLMAAMKAMKAMKAATPMKAMKAMKAMKKAKPDEAQDDEADQDDEANLMAMKAMKAMKAKAMKAKAMKSMAAMKAMKKKAKKVSKIAKGKFAKAIVFKGGKEKTVSGLKKGDLMKSKTGKIVSKKASANGKKAFAKNIAKWASAVKQARKALGLKGFVAIKKGSPLYSKAKSLYR